MKITEQLILSTIYRQRKDMKVMGSSKLDSPKGSYAWTTWKRSMIKWLIPQAFCEIVWSWTKAPVFSYLFMQQQANWDLGLRVPCAQWWSTVSQANRVSTFLSIRKFPAQVSSCLISPHSSSDQAWCSWPPPSAPHRTLSAAPQREGTVMPKVLQLLCTG